MLASRALADPTGPDADALDGLGPDADADDRGPDASAVDGIELDDLVDGLDGLDDVAGLDGRDDADSVDQETARSALDAGASFTEDAIAATSGLIDATSLHELEARHHRPSPWGRFDLAIAWRRTDRIDGVNERSGPSEPSARSRRHEVWLVATWRN